LESADRAEEDGSQLSGTTLRVYRFLFRQGKPVGVHEVQRGVGFQAASTAHYHLRKLVESGMVTEEPDGYVVDRILFEDMIRVGRRLIPVQATFASFFATILFFLVTSLRPSQVYAVWAIAIVVDCVALAVFVLQAIVTYQRRRL
jgi:DNA-binding transcriptional ArsR family regulator